MKVNGRKNKVIEELLECYQKLETKVAVLENVTRTAFSVPPLPVKRLHPDAVVPTRGTDGSAGLDLYSIEDVEIQPDSIGEIHTGIAMEMPPRCYGLLLTRSSMGKKMVRLSSGANAAPDNDYRGEIVVYLTNDGIYPWMIRKGDRVAQVVVQPYVPCDVVEVVELSETQRGADGFGSTGR